MCSVKKVRAFIFVAAAMAPPAFAVQPPSQGADNATATLRGGPAYGAPAHYAPPAYYGPDYGSDYRGNARGHGSGSGHMRVSIDFDGFVSGWMPWNSRWH